MLMRVNNNGSNKEVRLKSNVFERSKINKTTSTFTNVKKIVYLITPQNFSEKFQLELPIHYL